MFYNKRNKNNYERGCEKMKKSLLLLILVLPCLIAGRVFAATEKPITVQASVTSDTDFQVKLYRSTSKTTYDWTTNYYPTMDFGTLTNAIAGDTTSALTASYHYLALISVTNNTGTAYRVQYDGAPLRNSADTTVTLSNEAFTIAGGVHYAADGTTIATVYPSGLNTTRKSAGSTTPYDIYTSNSSGTSDIFRAYFGLTGDPTLAVDVNGNGTFDLIPPGQRSGSYTASIKFTLYP